MAAKKRIIRLIEGLQILEKYSNEVYTDLNQVVAGPVVRASISKSHQKILEDDLGWFFEENNGWSFYLG